MYKVISFLPRTNANTNEPTKCVLPTLSNKDYVLELVVEFLISSMNNHTKNAKNDTPCTRRLSKELLRQIRLAFFQ